MENPYQAPGAEIREGLRDTTNTQDVLSGQKLVIYAILLYFLAGALSALGGKSVAAALGTLLVAVSFLAIGWTGIYKISRGLGHSMAAGIFIMLAMLVPFIGLITLLVTNSRATKALKAAGYSVGLLGARRKQA